MPHSSGGGSHSGGTHSGGSSHHSSSSSSYSSGSSYGGSSRSYSPRISRSYYKGCTKYVYYNYWGKPHFIYADSKPTKPDFATTATIVVVLTALAGLLIWFMLALGLYVPRQLDKTSYDSGVEIIDDVGVLNNQKELNSALQNFLDKTGVSPAVEVVEDKAWINNYTDLETFAYSEYLRLFDDEKHWLVVISLPEDYKTAEFVDWKWEGMIGDDCYPAFNSYSEELFTTQIQRYLLRTNTDTMGQGLVDAYNSFSDVCMERQTEDACIIFSVFIFIVYVALLCVYVGDYLKNKHCHEAVRVTKNNPEYNCEYCGSLYLLGTVTKCPGCGAPAPARTENNDNSNNSSNKKKSKSK